MLTRAAASVFNKQQEDEMSESTKTKPAITRGAMAEIAEFMDRSEDILLKAEEQVDSMVSEIQYLLDGYEWPADLEVDAYCLMDRIDDLQGTTSHAVRQWGSASDDLGQLKRKLPTSEAILASFDEEALFRAYYSKRQQAKGEEK